MGKQILVAVLAVALVVLAVSAMQASAADKPTSAPATKADGDLKTWTGTAGRTNTNHRPFITVDGKRFEMKASDNAEAAVAETLKKISDGDTSKYTVKGIDASTGERGMISVVGITKVEK